jgi:hypothetical protein
LTSAEQSQPKPDCTDMTPFLKKSLRMLAFVVAGGIAGYGISYLSVTFGST